MGWPFRLLAPVVALLLGVTAAEAATVKSVAVEAAGSDVRVIVRFDGPFAAGSLFAMDAPARLVLDLPGARTDNRATPGAAGVSKVRSAQFSAEKARLVIDLAQPMTLGASTAEGDALTLTLHSAGDKAFAALKAKGRSKLPGLEPPPAAPAPAPAAKAESPAPGPEKLAVAEPAPAKPQLQPKQSEPVAAKPQPKPEPAKPAAPPLPEPKKATTRLVIPPMRYSTKPLVVIDPGHGGHDVGSLSPDGLREKDAALAISKAIAAELEKSGKVRVMLTRSDDRFIPLPMRVAITRRARPALFLSVHADSAPGSGARGATAYTLSEVASDREAAKLAARENRADLLGGVSFVESPDVADILIDLVKRETMNTSVAFVSHLERELKPDVPMKKLFHRSAGLWVLKAPGIPSVLLETGYMSSEEDAKFLFSDAGRSAIARGVRQAVEAHLFRNMAQK